MSLEVWGLLVLGGDESEWLVKGVRPLASEAFLLCAKACELELNTEEVVLASELAEPTPRRVSPESDWCNSSESGERYCLLLLRPFTLDLSWGRVDDGGSAPFASLTAFAEILGDGRG